MIEGLLGVIAGMSMLQVALLFWIWSDVADILRATKGEG